ncbi:hypothetical protein ScPMuIL_010921 [Solemya velum]
MLTLLVSTHTLVLLLFLMSVSGHMDGVPFLCKRRYQGCINAVRNPLYCKRKMLFCEHKYEGCYESYKHAPHRQWVACLERNGIIRPLHW